MVGTLFNITATAKETDMTLNWESSKKFYDFDCSKILNILKNEQLFTFRNPMCTVFPTMTSCSIPNVGASGVAQVLTIYFNICGCPFVNSCVRNTLH